MWKTAFKKFEGIWKYQTLLSTIKNGFPASRIQTYPDTRSFWEVRNRLSSSDNVVWLDNNRIVIPESYTTQILKILHSAHQGVSTMTKTTNQIIYWPGMHHVIRLFTTIVANAIKLLQVLQMNQSLHKHQNTPSTTYVLITLNLKDKIICQLLIDSLGGLCYTTIHLQNSKMTL